MLLLEVRGRLRVVLRRVLRRRPRRLLRRLPKQSRRRARRRRSQLRLLSPSRQQLQRQLHPPKPRRRQPRQLPLARRPKRHRQRSHLQRRNLSRPPRRSRPPLNRHPSLAQSRRHAVLAAVVIPKAQVAVSQDQLHLPLELGQCSLDEEVAGVAEISVTKTMRTHMDLTDPMTLEIRTTVVVATVVTTPRLLIRPTTTMAEAML